MDQEWVLLANASKDAVPQESVCALLDQAIALILRLASYGLIHCDFNEFNLLLNCTDYRLVIIDFPQMVSIDHQEARFYLNRDLSCVATFFERRFGYTKCCDYTLDQIEVDHQKRIDVALRAPGAKKGKSLDQHNRSCEKSTKTLD